jgi:hypothetical protein
MRIHNYDQTFSVQTPLEAEPHAVSSISRKCYIEN